MKKTAQKKTNKNFNIRISVSQLLSFLYIPAKDFIRLNIKLRKFSLKASLASKKFRLSMGFACFVLLLVVVSWKVISRPAVVEVSTTKSEPNKIVSVSPQEVLGDEVAVLDEATGSAEASSAADLKEATKSAVLGESIKLPDGLTPLSTPAPAINPPKSPAVSNPIAQITEKIKETIDKVVGKKAIKFSKSSLKFSENLMVSLENLKLSDLKVAVVYANGEEVNASIKEVQGGFEIEKEDDFKPGKYTVKITDTFGNNYTQDFTWGVLALNTDKSIYTPDETAKISIAVLDERGEMVCDAKLVLSINSQVSNEELSTENGKIKINQECNSKGFTLIPDYETSYRVKGPGEYGLTLTAETGNGTFSITDSFEVKDFVPFDIQRTSATRIYPPLYYPVYLDIKANEDFSGAIKEKAPGNFQLHQLNDKTATESAGLLKDSSVIPYSNLEAPADADQILTWNLSLKKGEKVRLGYQYKAPLKSPDFYTLGPLDLENTFKEVRQWQIAVDVSNPSIEQQINIIDQEFTTTSASYAPTDNSVGLIRFDSVKYSGSVSLAFEATLKQSSTATDVGTDSQIFCLAADDCKVVYYDVTNTSLKFKDCDDPQCVTGTVTIVDGATGCALTGCSVSKDMGQDSSIYCPATDDCKIVYHDFVSGTVGKVIFADCNNASCSSGNIEILDGDTNCVLTDCETADTDLASYTFVTCPAANNCKVGYRDASADSLKFADCDDVECSTGTVVVLDGDTGCTIPGCDLGDSGAYVQIICFGSTDCKIVARDATDSALFFYDCVSETCGGVGSSKSVLDGDVGCVLTGLDGCDSALDAGQHVGFACPAADNCKISYRDGGNNDLRFGDCANAACTSGGVEIIDGATGCPITNCNTDSVGQESQLFCVAADDCKVTYFLGTTPSGTAMIDCDNENCTSGTRTHIDGQTGCTLTNCDTAAATGETQTGIYCLSTSDCKIVYYDYTAGVLDAKFADCDNSTCSSGTVTVLDAGDATTVGLYNSSGTQVSCSSGSPSVVEVSTNSTSYGRFRSGAGGNTCAFTTTQLSTGDYTIRAKTSSGTASVKSARIIIVQTSATTLTDTQAQIEVGNNQTTTGTSMGALTNPKYYRYDNSKFSGTKNAYFEATLKASNAAGTPGNTSATFPQTASTEIFTGADLDWTGGSTVSNINSNDTNYATVSLNDSQESYYLKATNLGLDIPAGATINGIIAEVERNAATAGRIEDTRVRIIKADGTIGATERAIAGTWGNSDFTQTYGTSSDEWGETGYWTESTIEDADFGLAFAAIKSSTAGGAITASVDFIRITVHYTTAGVSGTAYAELYNRTDGQVVTNSEISTSSTSWTRVRGASALSTNWDTSNADDYEVRIRTSDSGAVASLANAKIIIDQTDAWGITATQIVHQYDNTLATDADTTYTSQNSYNQFNPANFVADTITYNFEVTIKTSNGSNAYFAQLYNSTDGSAISGSELTASDTSYIRKITSSPITMPASAKNMDIQLKNASTSTTSVSNSWLVIDLTFINGPTKVVITKTNGNSLIAGSCSGADYEFTLQLQNASNQPTNPSQSTTVRVISDSAGTVTIYSDSNCSSTVSNGDFVYTTSQNTKTFYVKDTRKSDPNWTLTADDTAGDPLTSDTENYTVNAGSVTRLVVTLAGQIFTDGVGNEIGANPDSQEAGTSFNITRISATDDYFNVNTGYSGSKNLSYSGPSNAPDGTTPSYTTSVNFSSGQSTTTLTTTLFKVEAPTITVTEGGSYGYASSAFTINPGDVSGDPSDSTVVASTGSALVEVPVTITITLKDTWRNPVDSVPAAHITIGATAASSITQPSSPTNASGVTTGSLNWTNSGSKTVEVTISTTPLVQNDGVTADADSKLDDTETVEISFPPAVLGISSGVKIKSGTKIRTN